jgi:competence protein ComEA
VFTRDERRALLFLGVLAAAGGVLRAVRSPAEAPGSAAIAPELLGEDIARQAELSRRAEELARPLQPGERVDVDRATAPELERLPRVGPELARRIVEERDSNGPFGSLGALRRVAGVGPGALRALERSVSFSGVPRPGASGVPPAPAVTGLREPCQDSRVVALNRATAEELDCLPGIGPALAARIVGDRERRGPFRRVEELERVPGIGPVVAARLRGRLSAP